MKEEIKHVKDPETQKQTNKKKSETRKKGRQAIFMYSKPRKLNTFKLTLKPNTNEYAMLDFVF